MPFEGYTKPLFFTTKLCLRGLAALYFVKSKIVKALPNTVINAKCENGEIPNWEKPAPVIPAPKKPKLQ